MNNPYIHFKITPSEQKRVRQALEFLLKFTVLTLLTGFVAMTIMEEHQPKIVPNVIGMDQKEALQVLSSKDLVLKIDQEQYDDQIPKGLISSQQPRANCYVKRGQIIDVVLSKGDPKVTVPSVIGESLFEAQISLDGVHLHVGHQSLIHSPDPINTVLAQIPAAGNLVDATTEVDLLVSDGTSTMSYLMPDFIHKPLEDAFKLLRPTGITIQNISREIHDDLDSGTVLNQTPLPGTNIQPDEPVSFVVSAKSSDTNLKPRYSQIVFNMPAGNPKRLQIDIFDGTGTRTIYNRMNSPGDHIDLGASVTGKAFAEIYLNQQFYEELPIP